MTEINERLAKLREIMKQEGISACIVPGTDPHASEYIADFWKEREWISGFDGSAGTAAVTLDKAGVWTDSRYFLQGEEQLEGTGFELMKQGLPDTLEIIPWLISELKVGEKVAVNSQMFSVNAYAAMKNELQSNGIQLVALDLMAKTWTDRPALPLNKLFVFDVKYAGKSASEKLQILRTELKKLRANTFIMSALDDIAWLFNIRGNDVSYNPVQRAQQLHQLVFFLGVLPAGRFIENQHSWPERQRRGDRDSLPDATGQPTGIGFGYFRQSGHRQRFGYGLPAFFLAPLHLFRPVGHFGRHRIPENLPVRILKHIADRSRHDLGTAFPRGFSIQDHLAGGGFRQPHHQTGQGCLAAAVAPGQPDEIAGGNRQGHIIQCRRLAGVRKRHFRDFKHSGTASSPK